MLVGKTCGVFKIPTVFAIFADNISICLIQFKVFIDGYTKTIKIVNTFYVRTSCFKPRIVNLFLRHVKKHSFSFGNIKRKFIHFKPIINLYYFVVQYNI